MTKRRSGKRIILQMFATMMAVTLVCLLACGTYALYSTQQELMYCNDAAMDVYFSGMLHTLEDMEQFGENIYYQNSAFQVLALDPELITDEQELMAWNSARLMVRSRTTSNTGIMVFDSRVQKRYFSMGSNFLGGMLNRTVIAVMDQACGFWKEQANPETVGWYVLVTDTPDRAVVLMQARRYQSVYICTMMDVTAYADTFENSSQSSITYAFLTSEQILTSREYAQEHGISLEQMLEAEDRQLHTKGLSHILQTRFDVTSGLGLCGMISTNSMWGTWWIFMLLLALSLIAICVTFSWIYFYTKKFLIYPMNKIREVSREIADGALTIQKDPENIEEFAQIQDALETLVGQKVILETEKMDQESQKEHAMLQYYQLQTRSHFLLNCLKSLYNLTARGDKEKTLRIITRFSNHIRYIFHNSLTLVPIRAELAEVDDYFDIIDQERMNHILLTKTVDPQLLEYPIPPLLIQTFVENFQKHNPESDKILHFSIQIDRVELEERGYVRIRLTDNGIGYSEEALQQLQQVDSTFAQFHVGIQNLCRRLEILYRQQHKIAFYNLPKGGACTVFYLPESFAQNHDDSPAGTRTDRQKEAPR